MKNIESLLPHRYPFLFVDRIISATDDEIIGIKSFNDGEQFLRSSFDELNFIPGAILIEAMAQCGGAGLRLLGVSKGLYGLASINSANFISGIPYQQEVKLIIKNIKVSSRIIQQSGIIHFNDAVALEANWTCVRLQK